MNGVANFNGTCAAAPAAPAQPRLAKLLWLPHLPRSQKLLFLQLIAVVLLMSLAMAAHANQRVALVIGNNDYDRAALFNPVNDANALGDKLRGLGYSTVVLNNADRFAIEAALDTYSEMAARAEFALFYYAGHAIQVNGRNYMIPVGAKLASRRDLKKLIPLQDVTDEVANASKLGVIVLDACRDNPFAEVMNQTLGRNGTIGTGLSTSGFVGGNTLIAYATEENAIAADGRGRHSPYTSALLDHIGTPQLDVRLMFGRVRDTVMDRTGGKQRPYVYGSVGGSTYFLNGGATDDSLRAPETATASVALAAPVAKPVADPATGITGVTAARTGQRITDTDFNNVLGQFKRLRKAIREKDRRTISQVAGPSTAWGRYLEYLFENFDAIDLSLSNVSTVDGDGSIIGELTIERMVRANGDIGIPSERLKSAKIVSFKRGDQWSLIQW